MGEGNGTLAAVLAIGGGLLLWKLLSDDKTATPAAAPTGDAGTSSSPAPTPAPTEPQTRPGPADSGGGFDLYSFPPGTSPKDIIDWFAANGNPHDAGPYLAATQNPAPAQPGGLTNNATLAPPLPSRGPTTPPLPVVPTTPPAIPPVNGTPLDTHEDLLGRTKQGPPSELETIGKPLLTYGGGAVADSLGTAAGLAAKGAAAVAGPVVAGVGLGLQVAQTMQDVGAFDKVKQSGAATSAAVGPVASKALATATLPLSLPGAVVKAAVTPGESIVGNLNRAFQASAVPEALERGRHAADEVKAAAGSAVKTATAAGGVAVHAAENAAGQAGAALQKAGSAFTSFLSKKWF